MNSATRAFIGSTVIAAVLLLLSYWPLDQVWSLETGQIWGLVGIVVIASISEAVAFYFGTGHKVTVSISFLPFLATIVLFPPVAAVLAVGTTVFISNIFPARRPPIKAAFNVSQAMLATGLGAQAYAFVEEKLQIQLIAFLVLVITFFAVNFILTTVAVSLLRGQPLTKVLKEAAGPRAANLFFDVFASPIALLLVFGYNQLHVWGLIFVVSPILVIRQHYASRLKLQQANLDLLRVLVKAIETRDPYTSGHSVRVAALATAIAEDLRLSGPRTEAVGQAALLHDIGKIDPAYSAVISKPHDLTAEEQKLIRTHSIHGAKLLQELSTVPAAVVAGVRHHHEKWDGSGYPDGLVGESIPLAARIIMLCDSIDAMLSDRPYRRALPVEVVRAELLRCAGTQFDPNIVRVVIEKDTIARAIGLVQDEFSMGTQGEDVRSHFVTLPA